MSKQQQQIKWIQFNILKKNRYIDWLQSEVLLNEGSGGSGSEWKNWNTACTTLLSVSGQRWIGKQMIVMVTFQFHEQISGGDKFYEVRGVFKPLLPTSHEHNISAGWRGSSIIIRNIKSKKNESIPCSTASRLSAHSTAAVLIWKIQNAFSVSLTSEEMTWHSTLNNSTLQACECIWLSHLRLG